MAVGIVFLVPLYGAQAHTEDVSLRLKTKGPRAYRLEGRFRVEASRQAVWDVLTDYSHMTQFVPSLRRSEVVERRPHGVLLKQEALGQVWMFSRKIHVLLEVTEEPLSEISFEDVSHQDFEYYKGTWQITDAGKNQEIVYHLETKRTFAAPNFLAEGALKENARNLLAEVRTEILRRGHSHLSGTCEPVDGGERAFRS